MSVRSQLDTLTRQGLSKATGLSLSHICLVLQGKRNPSVKAAMAIAAALDCSTDDLLSYLKRRRPSQMASASS
jgi:transcriptional regulator with XRE-family HTH domain